MSARTITIIGITILIALSVIILANSMTKELGRDEHMYCTGGVLLAQGKVIYRDFSYPSQLPYHPMLYAVLFKTLNTTRYLLVGRCVSVLADVLVMLCIAAVFVRAFGKLRIWGALLGLCAAVLYVYNPAVDYANGYAWNNDVVILCVALAFLLFTRIEADQKADFGRVALIGALLSLATFMRMTTAAAQLLFMAALLSLPAATVRERLTTIVPFLLATAVVSVYPVLIAARAPEAFFINIFRIHILNSEWLRGIGIVHDKLGLALTYLTFPGYLLLFAVAGYLVVALVLLRGKLKVSNARSALLAGLLAATFLAIALSLPTIWRQYLAPPVPFLILGFAYPLASLAQLANKKTGAGLAKAGAALMSLAALVAFGAGLNITARIPAVFKPGTWVPMQVHAVAADIANRTKEPKLVLTTAPLFALEGGCEIYTEFSAGVFAYRIDDLMTQEQRRITRTAGPQMLPELVKKSPPSAIIVGVEPEYFSHLEEPFETLPGADWRREVYENGLRVYFRP
ncbi:MAG: hypothetical protein JSW66_00295 [Phycisphaerales bacterium]|nr:MAG: hypothetical protein JSW66_00295 [Phycisphaerales bacterium]